MRNTADLTGATAAAVKVLLKANSGNPLHAETFDPLVIGDTLEVIAAACAPVLIFIVAHILNFQAFEAFLYRSI